MTGKYEYRCGEMSRPVQVVEHAPLSKAEGLAKEINRYMLSCIAQTDMWGDVGEITKMIRRVYPNED